MSKLVEKDAALEDKKTKWKDQSIVCYKRRQIMDWTQMMCTWSDTAWGRIPRDMREKRWEGRLVVLRDWILQSPISKGCPVT